MLTGNFYPSALAALLLFATSDIAAARPEPTFRASAPPLAVTCLTSPSPLAKCGATGSKAVSVAFEWGFAAVDVRAARADGPDSRTLTASRLVLEVRPQLAYDATSGSVMSMLSFQGQVDFQGGERHFAIEQDNVGSLFARSLFVQSEGELRFLLPAMFVEDESGARSFGVISFRCDSELSSCESLRVSLADYLASHGRQRFGFPGVSSDPTASGDSEMPQEPLEPACCFNTYTGSCHCQIAACLNQLCTERLPMCQDCDAFLCNC